MRQVPILGICLDFHHLEMMAAYWGCLPVGIGMKVRVSGKTDHEGAGGRRRDRDGQGWEGGSQGPQRLSSCGKGMVAVIPLHPLAPPRPSTKKRVMGEGTTRLKSTEQKDRAAGERKQAAQEEG